MTIHVITCGSYVMDEQTVSEWRRSAEYINRHDNRIAHRISNEIINQYVKNEISDQCEEEDQNEIEEEEITEDQLLPLSLSKAIDEGKILYPETEDEIIHAFWNSQFILHIDEQLGRLDAVNIDQAILENDAGYQEQYQIIKRVQDEPDLIVFEDGYVGPAGVQDLRDQLAEAIRQYNYSPNPIVARANVPEGTTNLDRYDTTPSMANKLNRRHQEHLNILRGEQKLLTMNIESLQIGKINPEAADTKIGRYYLGQWLAQVATSQNR